MSNNQQKAFQPTDCEFSLIKKDTFKALEKLNTKFDMVFVDPPYFLSNDGLTIKSGKVVSVNKGDWDKSNSVFQVNEFNRRWLSLVRENMSIDFSILIYQCFTNLFLFSHQVKVKTPYIFVSRDDCSICHFSLARFVRSYQIHSHREIISNPHFYSTFQK